MSLLDGVSAIVIAGYLGAVVYHLNANTLVSYLSQELGYVEFLIAAAILYQITKLPEGGPIAKAFIGVGMVAALIKLFSSIDPQTFSSFASGQTSVTQFFASIAQQAGKLFPQQGVQ